MRRCLLPDACSYCVSWNASVSVTWKGLFVACQDLPITLSYFYMFSLVCQLFTKLVKRYLMCSVCLCSTFDSIENMVLIPGLIRYKPKKKPRTSSHKVRMI